ncbi:MAG: CBS domain-containing protein [Candidatus Binataceae bacterium]
MTPLGERVRALPYFLNNLAPRLRSAWIALSRRTSVARMTRDDVARLAPDAPVARHADQGGVVAVILNRDEVLLGAIEGSMDDWTTVERRARDAMNPAPQTIRPDMTLKLAAKLLQTNAYLLVTDAHGRYLGRYHIPSPRPLLRE